MDRDNLKTSRADGTSRQKYKQIVKHNQADNHNTQNSQNGRAVVLEIQGGLSARYDWLSSIESAAAVGEALIDL